MASGFGPRGPRICQTHVIQFQDHAGNWALTAFRGEADTPLPFLYSYSIYFTHPDVRADNPDAAASAKQLYETITQGPRYDSNDVEFRLDLYFIPNGSRDACMQHYWAEKNARGSFTTQIEAVESGVRPSPNSPNVEAEGGMKMPGLVPSYVYDKISHRYHSLIYICDEADWQGGGDQTMTQLEFDPLSREDYEEFSKDPDDHREPDVLPETQTEVMALCESSPGYGRATGQLGRTVGSMGYHMWDRAPRQRMGGAEWREARDKGWTTW